MTNATENDDRDFEAWDEELPTRQAQWLMAAILAAPLIAKSQSIKTGNTDPEQNQIAGIVQSMHKVIERLMAGEFG